MDKLQQVISLCKRRGFVFPNSEIYGGIQGFYDYGPLGLLFKNNIKQLWLKEMLQNYENIFGIDGAIITHPRVWEASGHLKSFTDPLVDCKSCRRRFRADQLVEELKTEEGTPPTPLREGNGTPLTPLKEGNGIADEELIAKINESLKKKKVKCPNCRGELTEVRRFNLMVEVLFGVIEGEKKTTYLRGEACQNIYLNYKNVLDSMRPVIPFGIVQIGKAFRNEITPSHFLFREREFEQWDLQWFCHPQEMDKWFKYWKQKRIKWYKNLVNNKSKLRLREHRPDELAHYARQAFDIEYETPFGWKEWEGIHWRGDWDLKGHSQYSGQDFTYTHPLTKEKFIPGIIETSGGVDRTFLFLLLDAYEEEKVKGEKRVVLKLRADLAPYQLAVFPLLANHQGLVQKARSIYQSLKPKIMTSWDDDGNIGKRYRRQDEIGTPWCVTVDHQTLEDDTVTLRNRDSMKQERVLVKEMEEYFTGKLLLTK